MNVELVTAFNNIVIDIRNIDLSRFPDTERNGPCFSLLLERILYRLLN